MKTTFIEVLGEQRLVQVFSHDVGAIIPAGDLVEFEVFRSKTFLNPQVGHGQVSHPAEALPPADPDCCSRVGGNLEADGEAQVVAEGLEAQRGGGSLANYAELSLSGR